MFGDGVVGVWSWKSIAPPLPVRDARILLAVEIFWIGFYNESRDKAVFVGDGCRLYSCNDYRGLSYQKYLIER